MRFTVVAIVLLIFGCNHLFSQVKYEKYTPGFKFVDGIYRTFEEFKNNNPSISYKKIINQDKERKHINLVYEDSLDVLHKVNLVNIWGYSSNGAVYISINMGVYRVVKIGLIMHFVETRQYVDMNPNPRPNYSGSYRSSRPQVYQYIIDFETGNKMRFNTESLMVLLKKDPELYKEYKSIKSYNKKGKQKFIYLTKYNEKHPIYFPTSQ